MVSSITSDPYSVPKSHRLTSFMNLKVGIPSRLTELRLRYEGVKCEKSYYKFAN